jgi:hypothetical protein
MQMDGAGFQQTAHRYQLSYRGLRAEVDRQKDSGQR